MNSQYFTNETDLVAGLLNRNERAFSILYDAYSPALYGVILRLIPEEETAQDVLQEVFVKVYHNLPKYDADKGRLFTWLLLIARHMAIDELRNQKTRPNGYYRLSDEETARVVSQRLAVSPPPVECLTLLDLLSCLPESQRELISLRYFQGLNYREVSEQVGIPLGTVKTRIRNGLLKLRGLLNSAACDFV